MAEPSRQLPVAPLDSPTATMLALLHSMDERMGALEAVLRRDSEPTALLHKLHAAEQSCQERIAMLERFATMVTSKLAHHIAEMMEPPDDEDAFGPDKLLDLVGSLNGTEGDAAARQTQGQQQPKTESSARRKPRQR